MSDNTPPIQPRPPTTGQTIGRNLKGPFKRHTDGALETAKKCLKQADKFLRENARAAEVPYSTEEKEKVKEMVACLHQQLTNIRSLPQHLAKKISNPIFQIDPKYDETVEEMKEYLKASEFERLITRSISTIAMFEQECSTHNIMLEEFSQAEYTPEDFEAFGDDVEFTDKKHLLHQKIKQNSFASSTEMQSDEIFDSNLSIDSTYLQELKLKAKAIETTNMQSVANVTQHSNLPDKKDDVKYDSDDVTLRERADLYEQEVAAMQQQKDIAASQLLQKNKVQESAKLHPIIQPSLHPEVLLTENAVDRRSHRLHSTEVDYASQPRPTFSSTPDSNTQGIPKPTNIDTTLQIPQNHYEMMIQRIEQLEKEKEESQSFQRSLVERMEQMQIQYSREKTGPSIPNFESVPEDQKGANNTNNLYDDPDAYSTEYESDASYITVEKPHHSRTTRLHRDKSKSKPRSRGMSIDKVRRNLIVFNGSGRLEMFRDIYDEFVTYNDRLTDRMKYILLEQHLAGQAAQYIQPLSDPVMSVQKTFYELYQVFGDDEDTMALHDKFSSLPFHHYDWKEMTIDLAAHRSVVNLLTDKGVNVNNERTIRAFVKKLPPKIQDKILLRLSDTKDLNFQDIHDITTKYIKFFKTKSSVVNEKKFQGFNEIDETPNSILYTDAQASPYNIQSPECSSPPPPGNVVNSHPMRSNWTTSVHSNFSL